MYALQICMLTVVQLENNSMSDICPPFRTSVSIADYVEIGLFGLQVLRNNCECDQAEAEETNA